MGALLNRRRYMGGVKGLPYDAEVEYLQSTGTAYIDTGIYGDQNLKVELCVQELESTNSRAIFGVYTSNRNYYLYISDRGKWQAGFGGYANTNANKSTNEHTFVYDNFKFYIDGSLIQSYSSSTFTTPYTLLLFNMRNAQGGTYSANPKRIRYCKMWSSGVLVRDFIPVRVGETGYLYDRVSGTLFGNDGTGSFTLGADKSNTNDYIQDGLVFHLDGINKGATDGTWVDLVDGVVFTNAGSVSSLTNGWYFDATTDSYFGTTAQNNFLGQNADFTVEVCIVPERADAQEFVFNFSSGSSAANGVLFGMLGTNINYLQANGRSTITRVANSPMCVGLNQNIGIFNGDVVSKTSNDYWNNNSAVIGKRDFSGYESPFKGTIHAIRIYSRMLSYRELLHNQQLDNTRFNLGLTI